MRPSKLDAFYRRMLISKFFEKGWGNPENIQRLFEFRKIISNRATCYKLVSPDYPVRIVKEERHNDCTIIEGHFLTPLEHYLPGIVPKVAQQALFQVLLPNSWLDKPTEHKPICIHLAGTGDHFYWRRRYFVAKPLLREANMGAILLENPFYGMRKPAEQIRSNLHNVSDVIVMGGCLILECLVLLHWCERNGYGPLGLTGLSMGGHMASLAATNWPKPVVLVPCLSWSTAATAFTTGVMSQSINWPALEKQYHSDDIYCNRLAKMAQTVDEAYEAGKMFVQNFSSEETGGTAATTSKTTTAAAAKAATSSQKTTPAQSNIEKQLKYRLMRLQEIFGGMRLMKYFHPPFNRFQQYPNALLNKSQKQQSQYWECAAQQFMRGMMNECTHLKNFSVPFDTSLIIAVCAKNDAYVPREGCTSLEDIWPGCEVRYIDAGHVSGYILHQRLFRSCIIEAFERAKKVRSVDMKAS